MFYGTTADRAMWKNPVEGWGTSGDGQFSYSFVDPRHGFGAQRQFGTYVRERPGGGQDVKVLLTCGERETEFFKMTEPEAQAFLSQASFFRRRFRHEPYFLGRDDAGTYAYVDREIPLDDEGSRVLRLYRGHRGDLQLLALTDATHDSGGDVFVTAAGSLSVVRAAGEVTGATWIQGDQRTPLIVLPLANVAETVPFVFNELGVYEGVLLGTPCDDL
jgi:hypothetical protein